MNKNKAV